MGMWLPSSQAPVHAFVSLIISSPRGIESDHGTLPRLQRLLKKTMSTLGVDSFHLLDYLCTSAHWHIANTSNLK